MNVLILGGGLSGVAAALCLAEDPGARVTIVERGASLGGLAGSFEREGRFYPLGYHHILHRDRTLLFFLKEIGALDRVSWRRIRMFFRVGGRLFDLAKPKDFLAFPMSLADKARFATLMARAFLKKDWSDWRDRSASDLLDQWSSPGVRKALFEPLSRLKFELPCDEVSGAWLGARLHFREGSAALGYIEDANWTRVLCDGVARLARERGIDVRLSATVGAVRASHHRVEGVVLDSGEELQADLIVSSLPTEVYTRLSPEDDTETIRDIRYTALISVICASKKRVAPDFYWMNLASLDRAACGIFLLNSLNKTIGHPGDSCVNFVTHLRGRDRPFFGRTDEELLDAYLTDFREVFGYDLDPFWTNVARVPMYSPIFTTSYRNPPVRSSRHENVYFAGNYRTFPSIASTGTALRSGLEAGERALRDRGLSSELARRAFGFR